MRPSIQFRMPPSWFFKFPPENEPPAIPPPTDARTFASPFAIRPDIFVGALDYKVPITIAFLYASTVIVWNRINRERGYKPYGFSKTAAFKAFVIAHNVFLAVFSAFTFVGMIRALAHTWPGREHHLLGKFWPGLRTANGIAGATDALCKMHGPRGFGSAVSYDPFAHVWGTTDSSVALTSQGMPDSSDVGRLWNEGLAFWGWWFYLSKFYEVFDTFIILSKGKRSSTLQTYHHTGAMMCMWAGIRYMSPPIWMFCFLNSGIHAMMYVYYTLAALSIRVPQRVKRTLTTMQISQFIIGITFAAMHLFITYTVPVSKAYTVSQTVEAIASSMVAGVSSAAATASSAGVAGWLKQAALRAAGEEGLAENVLRDNTNKIVPHGSRNVTRMMTGYETVPCIDTNGQAFAVWLNLAYLAPLTGLFVRFFVKSYVNRGGSSRHPTHKRRISKSIQDAAHGTNRELDSLGKSVEDSVGDLAKEMNGKGANGNGTPRSRKVSSSIEKKWERFEKGKSSEDGSSAKPALLRKKSSEGTGKLRKRFEDAKDAAPKYTEGAMEKLEDAAEAAVKKVQDAVGMKPEDHSDDVAVADDSPTQEPTKDELEGSWADVHKDTYAYKDEQKEAEVESRTATSEERRPSSPETSRSSSPKKSKLPRPSSVAPTSRSRSPVKKQTSIPRPESKGPSNAQGSNNNTNGTKKQTPKSSGSEKNDDATSHSNNTTKSTSSNKEEEEEEEEKSNTNATDEQGSSETSTKDTEQESSGGDNRLQWRRVSSTDGGEAEREEGKTFADATKEKEGGGEVKEGQDDDVGEVKKEMKKDEGDKKAKRGKGGMDKKVKPEETKEAAVVTDSKIFTEAKPKEELVKDGEAAEEETAAAA